MGIVETIRGWIKPSSCIAKWLAFVKNMTVGCVRDCLPKHQASRYEGLDPNSKRSDSFPASAERLVQAQGLKQTFLTLGDDKKLSVQKMTKILQKSSDKSTVYLKHKDKRISLCPKGGEVKLGRKCAHQEEEEYAMNYIKERYIFVDFRILNTI